MNIIEELGNHFLTCRLETSVLSVTIQMGIKLGSAVCISLVLTAAPLEQVKPNCRGNNQEAQSLTLKVLYSMSKDPDPKIQRSRTKSYRRLTEICLRGTQKILLDRKYKKVIQTEKLFLNVFKKPQQKTGKSLTTNHWQHHTQADIRTEQEQ